MTERELFESWASKEGHCVFVNDANCYISATTDLMFKSWQASASRQGYKLVPVETLEELKRDADRMIGSAHLYQDECHIKSFGKSFLHIHKAMIGAVE